MPKLIATKSMRYATRRLLPGDAFEANNRDARVLMAIGKARDPRVPGAIQPPPASLVQRVKGKVDPLDHDGDKRKGGAVTADAMAELRKEYTQVVGKKPFAGWGAAELRHRINEASA